ncbi:BRO-N domain-containing protein [Laribacter hongkongensis]|uniref:BRO-N domain-containing protein n=1 Tax=Laribacter hongkongensis TaxID=168471 RepID=UPI001EFC82A4|nr:Bro-N domain-containing protein [Laribacter hongkongensis]MCG9083393.1 Bro-N domain-containing protein [Laribacter hongkongensis]
MHDTAQNTSAPAIFNFHAHAVRILDKDGELWFIASDVASALEYAHTPHMLRHLDDDEKGVQIVDTLGGAQEVSTISESGLYSAILRSRKPEAKRFKKWITSEVLPAIRKNGQYTAAKRRRKELREPAVCMSEDEAFNLYGTLAMAERACKLLQTIEPAFRMLDSGIGPRLSGIRSDLTLGLGFMTRLRQRCGEVYNSTRSRMQT